MKIQKRIFTGILFLLFQSSFGQGRPEWKQLSHNHFWYDWSIDFNIGFTSYFGDLSQYDLSPAEKLVNESKPAFGVKLTKNILKHFGISGQLIYGGLKSNYKPGHSFGTNIFEYNVQASVDLTQLLVPNRKTNFGWTGYAGIGQFLFKTTGYKNLKTSSLQRVYRSAVPEFVYFFGTTMYFAVSETVRLTAGLSIRQAQNDNLDLYISGTDFDYYSYLGFGISVSINNLRQPFNKKPNCKDFDVRIIGLVYENLELGIFMADMVDKTYQIPCPSAGSDILVQLPIRVRTYVNYYQSRSMD